MPRRRGRAPPPRRRVALVIETSNDYARGLLHGIRAYIRERRTWTIFFREQSRGQADLSWLTRWRGDGIIARIENRRIARAVARTGLPAVDVSAARCIRSIPWVETDDAAIARAAFDHLFERGFRSFGYCHQPGFNWSGWRMRHFERLARRARCRCSVHLSPRVGERRRSWSDDVRQMAGWVGRLAKPVGIMACYDIIAQRLLEACRLSGTAVPDEVAVIGVDNDELLCDLADPPLTSVIPDTWQTGYLAARLLDRMMSGARAPPKAHLITPLGIAERLSTDILAIDDPLVSQAVRFIRQNACSGIKVGDVLRQVPLSRRVLESRFKALTGRTPHGEIVRVRLRRAKELLGETDLTVSVIARRLGFEHTEYFSASFKQATGYGPRRYRQECARREA